MTRIRYQGRDYHTPAYMPVQERERIEGMDRGYNRVGMWVMIAVMSCIFWAAVFGFLFA